jgi:hypothetical protein
LDGGRSYGEALSVSGAGSCIARPLSSRAGDDIVGKLRAADAGLGVAADELLALGLIATRAGAADTLAQLTGTGLLQADPRFHTIRLNAALEERESA